MTKGDNNYLDDRSLYPARQYYLYQREVIIGIIRGYISYIGYVSLALQGITKSSQDFLFGAWKNQFGEMEIAVDTFICILEDVLPFKKVFNFWCSERRTAKVWWATNQKVDTTSVDIGCYRINHHQLSLSNS
jgi:hypothetical protein